MTGVDPMAFVLTRTEEADPFVRPFAMEALIRQGSAESRVFERFKATPEETTRVAELLAGPPVEESY